MKYLPYFILALVLNACDGCRYADCIGGVHLPFRVVDANGKDLVTDLKVKVDSLDFRASDGRELYIEGEGTVILSTFLEGDVSGYTLSFDGRTTEITVEFRKTGKGCCGPTYDIVSVTSDRGPVPTEPGIVYADDLTYVITL